MKRIIHDDGCHCGRCYRQQADRQYRDRKTNHTGKERNWMDIRAEEIWKKHQDKQPDFAMFRSPLRDL
jgi:hypothetical protein